jgi:hypothetical protein
LPGQARGESGVGKFLFEIKNAGTIITHFKYKAKKDIFKKYFQKD